MLLLFGTSVDYDIIGGKNYETHFTFSTFSYYTFKL
jgi:hypothetical protein